MGVAWVNLPERGGPFCGGITVAVADVVIAADVKCINIKISVDYQLYKNRIYMMLGLS